MLSPPLLLYYMGCVKITLLATYAFNAIMSLSRASTRGSYSRIEGVTFIVATWQTSARSRSALLIQMHV